MLGSFDSGVQEQGCGALRVLAAAYPEIQAEVARQGGIQAVAAAMAAHVSVARLQERGCGAFWNMSLLPANHAIIAQEHGIRMVVKAMVTHERNIGVQKRGCGALRCEGWNHDAR
eukprot:975358-Rhodomonas_salina.2